MAKFCSECGAALEAGDRFCVACGARTAAGAPVAGPALVAAAPVAAAAQAAPANVVVAAAPALPAKATREGGNTGIVTQLRWEIVLGALVGAASAVLGSEDERLPGFILGFVTGFIAVLIGHTLVSLVARVMKPLAVLLAILMLLGGAASAAGYYVIAPDMPGGIARFVPDVQAIWTEIQPLSGSLRDEPRPPREELVDPAASRESAALALIASTGVPVTAAFIETAPDGQETLVVGISYDELVGFSGSLGFEEGIDAFLQLAELKALDISGLGYVTTVLQDGEGRPLLSISAPATVLESFRAGTATRTDLIRGIAFKGESRRGILEAAQKQLVGR